MSYVELRFLVPQKVAEIIVGPSGRNVDRLHMEYRAVLNITKTSTPEKVLTIGGMDIVPLCKLLQDLLTTISAAGFDQYGYECENDLSLLVDDSQVDTLTSLEQLQLLVEETGARVDVFPMCCPHSTDRVVRVCGMPMDVAQSIFGLHSLLKQCPVDFSCSRHHYDADNADASIASEYGGYTSDYVIGTYHSSDAVPTGSEDDSTSVVVTKRYSMPTKIRSVVTGRNGYRLEHVENESGATVDIGGTGSYLCPVSITGTQQQIDNARLLLRMCIGYFCVRVE